MTTFESEANWVYEGGMEPNESKRERERERIDSLWNRLYVVEIAGCLLSHNIHLKLNSLIYGCRLLGYFVEGCSRLRGESFTRMYELTGLHFFYWNR